MSALPPRRRVAACALGAATIASLAVAAVALAAPPREVQQPTLEGTFRRGSTIAVSNGRWVNNPTSFRYRWFRCDANGANCFVIGGETRNTYRLRAADVNRTVKADVIASNRDGTRAANTKPSPVIADNIAPQNTRPPSISGSPVVGATLTAEQGDWAGLPDSYAFAWLQCDAAGANCADTGAR
jgi:hypothetical protein